VTAAEASKLKWVLPVRIVPPLDVDATDLFLDSGDVARCCTEIHA
jgi:hypothetical protein